MKEKVIKIVATATATSIFAASCTSYNDNLLSAINDENFPDMGQSAIPLKLNLSSEDIKNINAINRLVIDIIENSKIAEDFTKNPQEILKLYGYTGAVTIDDKLVKIIKAFADDEITMAIKQKNIEKFVSLCQQKGLQNEKYNEFLTNKLDSGTSTKTYNENVIQDEAFLVVGVVVVAVFAVAIALSVETYMGFHHKIGNGGCSEMLSNEYGRESQDVNVIDVLYLKTDTKDYQYIDNCIDNSIEKAIDLYFKDSQQYKDNESRNQLKQLIYKNLVENNLL